MIKILIGGSPCTKWSIAQKNDREVKPEGIGWELFRNYLIAKEKFKPDLFLYENNKSAAQPIKDQISRELGVDLMHINSALVSAQDRWRFYAFNWSVEQPKDRGLLLKDILEEQVLEKYFYDTSKVIYTGGKRVCAILDVKALDNVKRIYSPNGKAPTLTTCGGGHRQAKVYVDGRARKLTPLEYERLQTLPDGYTAAICDTERYNGLGNGWTAEVIIHILSGALKDVPRDEEIVVLSMYDGIGTGRYCFDKMGFTNVTYYAYEIAEPVMKVALSNYPDIIQLGDAFDLRRDDWELGKRFDAKKETMEE